MSPLHPPHDVVSVLTSTPRFRTLVTILVASQVLEDLRAPGPWLVLAPPDDAFAQLPGLMLRSLLSAARVEALVDLAEHLVVRAPFPRGGGRLRTLLGEVVEIDGAGVVDGGAGRVRSVRLADNGTVAVVDRVLLPRALRPDRRARAQTQTQTPTQTQGRVAPVLGLPLALAGERA